jgi:hypothetical protein
MSLGDMRSLFYDAAWGESRLGSHHGLRALLANQEKHGRRLM